MNLLSSAYGSESETESEDLETSCSAITPGQNISSRSTSLTVLHDPSFSQTVGYVSKRKRKTQEPSIPAESEPAAAGVNILSSYSTGTSPSAKQMKQHSSRETLPRHLVKTLSGHTKPVLSVEWHSLDQRLLISASLDSTVKLWDVEKLSECVTTYHFHSKAVRDVEWITSETFLTAGYDSIASYVDAGYSKEIVRLKHDAFVSVVKAHTSDKNLVLTGDFDGQLQLWDLRICKPTKQYKGAGGKILDMIFLPEQDVFVASSDIVRRNAFSQAMNVWDLKSGVTLTHQLYFEPFTCPCLKAHRNRDEFLAQSNGNYIILFSAKKPFKLNKHKRFQGHYVSGFDVGFDLNFDGSVLCSASSEGKVHFYDYASTRMKHTLTLTDSACLAVAWNQISLSRVAVSNWNGSIHVIE